MADDHFVKLQVEGLKAFQQSAANTAAALEPTGKGQAAIQFATLGAHSYMTKITHYKTGRLRNSLYPLIDGLTGEIITNVNYAPAEEERGGQHAFMRRTADEAMPKLAEETLRMFETVITGNWEG